MAQVFKKKCLLFNFFLKKGLLKAKTLNDELSIKIEEQYPTDFNKNFEVLSQIGKGCQGGVVCSVKEKETGQIFAAKMYRTRDDEQILLVFFIMLSHCQIN